MIVNEPQRGNPVISAARFVRKKVDSNYSEDQLEFSKPELLELFRSAGYSAQCFPQGVLSTPFAETTFLPDDLGGVLSGLACRADRALDRAVDRRGLERLSWNVVVHATAEP